MRAMARERAMSSEGATRVRMPLRLCHSVDPPNRVAGANEAAWLLLQKQRGVRAYGKLMARLIVTRRKRRSKVDKRCKAGGRG
jgi:hypothetical protein